MSDKPKSVLDVIGWCKELEQRLEALEGSSGRILASGEEKLKNALALKNPGNAEERNVAIAISFKDELSESYDILPSIVALDASGKSATRFDVYTKSHTPKGFDLVVSTWGDTSINIIVVRWVALATHT